MENVINAVMEDDKIKVEKLEDEAEMAEMDQDESLPVAEAKAVTTKLERAGRYSATQSLKREISSGQRYRNRKRARGKKSFVKLVAAVKKGQQDLRDKLIKYRARVLDVANHDWRKGRQMGRGVWFETVTTIRTTTTRRVIF